MTPVGLLTRATWLLAASRLLLRRRGTTSTLLRLARSRSGDEIDPQRALRAVRRSSRIVGGLCLPQSVALAALLQRTGLEPALVLGCHRQSDGGWTAHAWVQVGVDMLEPVRGGRHAALAMLREADGWVPSAVPQDPDQPMTIDTSIT